MKSKSETHHSLSTLFARDGVPNVMVVDNAMGQTAGEFNKKARDSDWHTRTTEPLPPRIKQYELGVQEANKGVDQKMIKENPEGALGKFHRTRSYDTI